MTTSAMVHVVDDDDVVRESTACLVETIGLCVRTYQSAEDFLTGFEATERACLILDVRMPGMSGIELFDILTARQILLPVIFITGHSDDVTVPDHQGSAATWFLEKPFRPRDLQQRVQWALAAYDDSSTAAQCCDNE